VTNPRVFRSPQRAERPWAQIEAWLDAEAAWIPTPTSRHREVFGSLVTRTGAAAELLPDAHLAALAIEHGLELLSTDGDFARFPGLRWTNPLDPGSGARPWPA
jgi:uncharacterized protein